MEIEGTVLLGLSGLLVVECLVRHAVFEVPVLTQLVQLVCATFEVGLPFYKSGADDKEFPGMDFVVNLGGDIFVV